jgi:hypothetical protein
MRMGRLFQSAAPSGKWGRGSYIWLTLACLLLVMPLAHSAGESVQVAVRKSALRDKPDFLARRVADAVYTDRLTVIGSEGEWLEVELDKKRGWIHGSAVSDSLTSGGGGGSRDAKAGSGGGFSLPWSSGNQAPTAADSPGGRYREDEVTLAGKGFNSEVEEQYRRSGKKTDYPALDRIQKSGPDSTTLAAFRDSGELVPRQAVDDLRPRGALESVGEGAGELLKGIGGLFGGDEKDGEEKK